MSSSAVAVVCDVLRPEELVTLFECRGRFEAGTRGVNEAGLELEELNEREYRVMNGLEVNPAATAGATKGLDCVCDISV